MTNDQLIQSQGYEIYCLISTITASRAECEELKKEFTSQNLKLCNAEAECERMRAVLLLCSWEIGRDKSRGWIGGRDAEERLIIEKLLITINAAAGVEGKHE
jgi:hypothetical protein